MFQEELEDGNERCLLRWNLVTANDKTDLLSKTRKRSAEDIGGIALLLTLSEQEEM